MQEANCISTCLVFLWRLERAPVLADSLIMVPNDSSKVWWFLNMENGSQTFLVQFKFRSCFGQSGWWFLEKLKCLYVSSLWEKEHGILCQKEGVNPHDGFCPKDWCFAASFPPPSPPSPNFLSIFLLSFCLLLIHAPILQLSLFLKNVAKCHGMSPSGSWTSSIWCEQNRNSIQKTTMKSCVNAKLLQSCPTLCNPVDHSLPGSSVHRILQATILEWVAILSSRGPFWPRDRTHVSCISHIAGGFFTIEPQGKPMNSSTSYNKFYLIYHNSFYTLDIKKIMDKHAKNYFSSCRLRTSHNTAVAAHRLGTNEVIVLEFLFIYPLTISVQSLRHVGLCNPMNHSTPGLPVRHQIPESTQTHVCWVGDAIQPSHPLSSPSPLALNLSQHQGLF